MTVIIGLALKYTMGWRLPAEHGVAGVDLSTQVRPPTTSNPRRRVPARPVFSSGSPNTQEVTA